MGHTRFWQTWAGRDLLTQTGQEGAAPFCPLRVSHPCLPPPPLLSLPLSLCCCVPARLPPALPSLPPLPPPQRLRCGCPVRPSICPSAGESPTQPRLPAPSPLPGPCPSSRDASALPLEKGAAVGAAALGVGIRQQKPQIFHPQQKRASVINVPDISAGVSLPQPQCTGPPPPHVALARPR